MMIKTPFGYVHMDMVDPQTGLVAAHVEGKNALLNEASDILGKVMSGDPRYVPAAFYIEFKNGTAPARPTIDPAEGRSYYAGLETLHGSTFVDYLRVPRLFLPAISSSDPTKYPCNQLLYTIASQGAVGVCGLPFSAAANSVVYVAALVAAPVWEDRTQDLVFARFYPATALPKSAATEVNIRWPYVF